MRRVSFNARRAQEAQHTDEIEVVLVIIEHPALDGGILRFSSHPAMRVPGINPPIYATYSTWRTTNGAPFYAVPLDALIPDEKDDAPSRASLVIPILDSDVAELLTSTAVQAICHMAVVMASSPDLVEGEYTELRMADSDINAAEAALRFSTEAIYDEPFPAHRMTKERFPGLHR